jgi:hypothetical protein
LAVVLGLAGSAVGLGLVAARPADAIPAWTRKYGMDCSSCHVAGFKLNRLGQNFLRAGHTMADDAGAKNDVSTHVSVAQKSRFNWSTTEVNDVTTAKTNSFEQHALSLYMGGPLQKEFSYFAELYWHENSGNTSGASDLNDYGRSKLADAYLQYLNRQSDESWTSVRFGQFSPYLLHLHGVGARLSQDRPYVINSGTVGDNPYKAFQRQYGLEVSQYVRNLYAAVGLMNGTGGKLFNRVDNDLKKDVYGTVDYSLDEAGSMLGLYGYLGHYPLAVDKPTAYVGYDDFNQLGVLGNYSRKEGAVVASLYSGKNEFTRVNDLAAPFDSLAAVDQKSLGYYAELQVYALHPRLQPYFRWDFWDVNTDVDDNEVSGPLVGVSWRAMDAGRLVLHYQQLTSKKGTSPEEKKNSIVFEANFMF